MHGYRLRAWESLSIPNNEEATPRWLVSCLINCVSLFDNSIHAKIENLMDSLNSKFEFRISRFEFPCLREAGYHAVLGSWRDLLSAEGWNCATRRFAPSRVMGWVSHVSLIIVLDLGAFLYEELHKHRTMAARFVFAITPHREVGVMRQGGQQFQYT
jgi:hypothetical protein